jgi:hypothetical protein
MDEFSCVLLYISQEAVLGSNSAFRLVGVLVYVL